MKTIKFIAAAFFALTVMACGSKPETPLEKYEALVNETVEAMNNGDTETAGKLYDELNALSPEIDELCKNGTPEEIAKINELNKKYVSAFNK